MLKKIIFECLDKIFTKEKLEELRDAINLRLQTKYPSKSINWEDYHACYCPDCKFPCVIVRPGKCQWSCDCHLKCYKCGREKDYFSPDEHPKFPNVVGWYCGECGPEWTWPEAIEAMNNI